MLFPPGTPESIVAAVSAAVISQQSQQQPPPFQLSCPDGAFCKPVRANDNIIQLQFPQILAQVTATRDIAAGEIFLVEPLLATSIALLRSGRIASGASEQQLKTFYRMLGIDAGSTTSSKHSSSPSSVHQLALLRAWRFVDVLPNRTANRDWMHAGFDDAEPLWSVMDELCAALSAAPAENSTIAQLDCMLVQLPAAVDGGKAGATTKFVLYAREAIPQGQRCHARCFQRCSDLPSMRTILFGDSDDDRASSLAMCVSAAEQFIDATSSSSSEQQKGASVAPLPAPRISKNKRLTFYTDSQCIIHSVKDPRLVQVQDPARADIVYLVHAHFASTADYPSAKFLSSFPEEKFFSDKDGLAKTVRSELGYPPWLPRSFDSETELHIFCGAHQLMQSKRRNEDDGESSSKLWIAKSRALARGMGHLVLESLPWLLRCREALPRVICEYIERPVLVRGRKFDVRFVLLVTSLGNATVGDGEVFLYNEIFPRLAAQPYTLDRSTLSSYQTHFTLAPGDATEEELARMKPTGPAFEAEFNREHGEGAWAEKVMPKVRSMFKELFSNMPLVGGEVLVRGDDAEKEGYLRQRQRFRAMYGCDVMVQQVGESDFQPMLLEVTFAPDSDRAVRTIPAFFDHVFNTLFRAESCNSVKL